MTDKVRKKSSTLKKETLLEMARNGGLKPQANDKLGMALRNYMSPQSLSFDPSFAETLRNERPDWFEKPSLRNKAKLVQLADEGKNKSELPQSLKVAFRNYINKDNESYDPAFHQLMEQKVPTWFVKSRTRSKSND